MEELVIEQTAVCLNDEARRLIDENIAYMRELHRGTLALMHELHAEKMRAFDRLEERLRRSGNVPIARRRRKR